MPKPSESGFVHLLVFLILIAGVIGAVIFFYPPLKTVGNKWSDAFVGNLSNRLFGIPPVAKTPVPSSVPASAPTKQSQAQKVIAPVRQPTNTAPSPTPTPTPRPTSATSSNDSTQGINQGSPGR